MTKEEILNDIDDLNTSVHEVFFQFDDEEPIKLAYVVGGEFSLKLSTVNHIEPTIEFSSGSGKSFKLFLKNT